MKLADFNKAVQDWVPSTVMPIAATVQRNVLTDMVGGLVDINPVGDPRLWNPPRAPKGYVGGHSKRNWRVYLHRDYAAAERSGVDPTGQVAKAEASAVISRIQNAPVEYCTVSNPVPYMDALANGWSKQAPAGWIEAVVAAVTTRWSRKVSHST